MAFVAALAEHVKALALASDLAAARVANEALKQMLDSAGAPTEVVDLADVRRAYASIGTRSTRKASEAKDGR